MNYLILLGLLLLFGVIERYLSKEGSLSKEQIRIPPKELLKRD